MYVHIIWHTIIWKDAQKVHTVCPWEHYNIQRWNSKDEQLQKSMWLITRRLSATWWQSYLSCLVSRNLLAMLYIHFYASFDFPVLLFCKALATCHQSYISQRYFSGWIPSEPPTSKEQAAGDDADGCNEDKPPKRKVHGGPSWSP